jgi:hypothetical protein
VSRGCASAQRSFRDIYTCVLWCLEGARPRSAPSEIYTCVLWCLECARARSALSDIVARRAAGGAEALGSQAGALTAPRLPPVQSAEFRLVEAGLEKDLTKN